MQRDVDAMAGGLYSGNLDIVLDYTHPAIVEGLGGREQAREKMAAAVTPMLQKGCRVDAFRFPKPPEFVRTDVAVYAIVPTLMTLSMGDERTESLNYQFGVLDQGTKKWKYIEGSRINAANVNSLFPDFPANYPFPRFYRKRL